MALKPREVSMEDELKGYDYEELIDKWGLRKKYKKLYKAIGELSSLALISDDEGMNIHEELGARLLTEYIGDAVTHDNDGNTFIDKEVHEDMLDFLAALSGHAVCSDGDRDVYATIRALGENPEKTFEFYRWFIHSLPLMWN